MADYSAKAVRSTKEIKLEGGQVSTTLEKYVLQVLPKDVLTVLRQVAYQELAAQVSAGNPPTQILVDGRGVQSRGIDNAQRSVSMRFADTTLLIAAVTEAYNILQRITRIQSPPKNDIVARRNFFLWLNGKPFGLLPGALSRLQASTLNEKSVLRVVGPLVPYGRKLYWNPVGRGKAITLREVTNLKTGNSRFTYDNPYSPRFKPFASRTLRRIANRTSDPAGTLSRLQALRPGYVEGANQIAKRVMRRNRLFASLYISDGWVSFPPAKNWGKASKDDRVPSLSIQIAKRGSVVNLLKLI